VPSGASTKRCGAGAQVQVVGQRQATGVAADGTALTKAEDQDDHQRHHQKQQEPQGGRQQHQQRDASAQAASPGLRALAVRIARAGCGAACIGGDDGIHVRFLMAHVGVSWRSIRRT
jgi:hypothetical protein